jgi:Rrf2 family iron-sulfur cluster assembly transcriptional regulator
MNITSKSKYALRAVIHLAQQKSGIARREDLASAQGGISTEYLEKILLRLRENNILTAKSGPGGGYRLARPASEMTAWDVINAVEESLQPVSCLGNGQSGCSDGTSCEAKPFWERVWGAAAAEMKNTSIASLLEEHEMQDERSDLQEGDRAFQCK